MPSNKDRRYVGFNNPVSTAISENHPDAEDDLYQQFWKCATLGDLHDLLFNAMHVEGRDRQIDWRRLERRLHCLRRQQENAKVSEADEQQYGSKRSS